MSSWREARTSAQALALAIGMTGLPFAAAAGQPETGAADAAVAMVERYGPLAGLSTASPPRASLAAGSDGSEPFDLPVFDRPSRYGEKWIAVANAIAGEGHMLARCRGEPEGCPSSVLHFLAIVKAARMKEGRARLGEVNRAVNMAIRYRSDAGRDGAADVWSTPLATFASGEGDCEDYAIAKYVALREAGVPPRDLRLVVVRDTKLEQDHAILAARLDERWVVLDNRRLLLLEDRDVRNYRPLTAFASGGDPWRLAAGDANGGPGDSRADAVALASNPS